MTQQQQKIVDTVYNLLSDNNNYYYTLYNTPRTELGETSINVQPSKRVLAVNTFRGTVHSLAIRICAN